jgi:putative spermidine/putrescine transport system ATP-binding protein
MQSLSIRSLTKSYGDGAAAVRGIDLEVAEGEFVSLLGPSGCGKTTTLRCIAGLETPSGGRIAFGTRDVTDLPSEKRDIGMVFQNYALFPHMTVQQNVSFGLEMRGQKGGAAAPRIQDVLAMVQLNGFEGRYPRELSGGQQQRVALARALVIEPALLLLDEPLANLDAKLREEMRVFIRGLQRRIGITTLYVTHDQAESMIMSDRIIVMFDGRIHQAGSPADIYHRPATRAVAEFIGLSNFVEGEVLSQTGQRAQLATPIGEILCRTDSSRVTGQKATAMVRPEALVLSASPDTGSFPCQVVEVFFRGNLTELSLRLDGGSTLQAQVAAGNFEREQRLHARILPEAAWLLP